MILPQFKERFVGDSGVDIATEEIDVVFPDGEKRRVTLRLGAPYAHDRWIKIRSELEGLDRTDGPLVGDGSMHAVICGIRWIVGRLEVFQQKLGCQYFWPDSAEVFDFRDLFSTTKQDQGEQDARPNASEPPPSSGTSPQA